MRDVLGSAAPSDDQVKEIIKHIDTDKSGDIDFGEFMGLMSDPKFNDLAKNEHRQAFEMFDKDGNGHISLAELRDAFSKIGGFLVNLPPTRQPHGTIPSRPQAGRGRARPHRKRGRSGRRQTN